MKSVQFLPVFFAIILCDPVRSEGICEFEDSQCIKYAINRFYRDTVIPGIPCVVEPSDPLHYLGEITGQIECLSYKLSNVTMTGLKNCAFTKTTMQSVGLTYEYTLVCPKLVLNYIANNKGTLGGMDVVGRLPITLIATDYVVFLKGKYVEYISDKNGKSYMYVKYNHVETDAKGKLFIETPDRKGRQLMAYLNSNPWLLRDFLRDPTMPDLFNEVFINNVNAALRVLPLEELFST